MKWDLAYSVFTKSFATEWNQNFTLCLLSSQCRGYVYSQFFIDVNAGCDGMFGNCTADYMLVSGTCLCKGCLLHPALGTGISIPNHWSGSLEEPCTVVMLYKVWRSSRRNRMMADHLIALSLRPQPFVNIILSMFYQLDNDNCNASLL